MALTLTQAIQTAKDDPTSQPILLVELELYNSTTELFDCYRFTDSYQVKYGGYPGYWWPQSPDSGGNHYLQMVKSDLSLSQSKEDVIDELSIEMDNSTEERYFSRLFNSCSINDWVRSIIRVYRTFRGLDDRVQIYEGFLEIPEDISDTFVVKSKQLIDVIGVQFPNLTYAQTCNWVNQFGDGRRCNYNKAAVGADQSCSGTWSDCVTKSMQHRFGGIKHALMRGAYTYKNRRMFWFDNRKTATYETQENMGLFGSVIPAIYGMCRVSCDVVWQTDIGAINKFVAVIGHGPIDNLIQPPKYIDRKPESSHPIASKYADVLADMLAWIDRDTTTPEIIINNLLTKTYAFYRGLDGSSGSSYPDTWSSAVQSTDYLWTNESGTSSDDPNAVDPNTIGQSYSGIAYIIGQWPSSDNKDPDTISEIEVYVKGLKIWVATEVPASSGTFSWALEYSDNPAWVWLDILTNQDYGAGLDRSLFDIAKIIAASHLCNAEDFHFSHVFREKMDILEALSLVCHSCRGYTAYANGKYYIVVQTQASMVAAKASAILSPAYIFDNSHVILGSDSYMSADPESKSNKIEVPYIDYDQDWQTTQRILDDTESQSACGKKNPSSIKFAGVCGAGTASTIDGGPSSTLSSSVTMSQAAWPVANATSFAAGDYVKCDDEICRVFGTSSGQLQLEQAEQGIRAQYCSTSYYTHSAGATVTKVDVTHTGMDAANKLAYYHLNRSRLLRRKDGRKRVRGGIDTMHLQIGDIVKLDLSDLDYQDPTHDTNEYDGLYEIESVSWDGEEAEYSLMLAETSIFDVTGISPDVTITPENGRRYPYSVEILHSDITGYEVIEETVDLEWLEIRWTIPAKPSAWSKTPMWVSVYMQREGEHIEITSQRVESRVLASDCYAKIRIPSDMWNETAKIYLSAESIYGIKQPIDVRKTDTNTILPLPVDATSYQWLVLDAAKFSSGDYVFCESELCKVASVGESYIVLEQSSPGIRAQYQMTAASAHTANSIVIKGHAWNLAASSSPYKVRDTENVVWQHHEGYYDYYFGAVSAFGSGTGTAFYVFWKSPDLVIARLKDQLDTESGFDEFKVAVPEKYTRYFELGYDESSSFDAADGTDISINRKCLYLKDVQDNDLFTSGHLYKFDDPAKTYYFALRAVFVDGTATPWGYHSYSSGVLKPVTTIDSPLIGFYTDDALQTLNLKHMSSVITDASSTATSWIKLTSTALEMYSGSHQALFVDLTTGKITIGDYPDGQHLVYDTATRKLNISAATIASSTAIGGTLLSKQSWTGNGTDTAFNLPGLRATNSDPMVSVNGIIQNPGTSYTVSDGATYSTITFIGSFVPASGDVILCWYQAA